MKAFIQPTPTFLIDTTKKLSILTTHLATLTEFSIDTEFDRFRYQYGIHLQLIQIFDGENCYLIDSIKLKDLSSLWAVFEDENICKIIYSGSEDVDILKKFGCVTRNLFDIQIAAALCNREETSYSKLVAAEFAVEIDKKLQTSRWDTRPLTESQLKYASNDVIYLPQLKSILLKELKDDIVLQILQEENKWLELASSEEYAPKLTGKQKAAFNAQEQEKLLALKILIDTYAKRLNESPYLLVPDGVLEDIVKNKTRFLQNPFARKFHKALLNDEKFKEEFLNIVNSIKVESSLEVPIRDSYDRKYQFSSFKKVDILTTDFPAFKKYIIDSYGEIAAVVILRGLQKIFSLQPLDWAGTRKYQEELFSGVGFRKFKRLEG